MSVSKGLSVKSTFDNQTGAFVTTLTGTTTAGSTISFAVDWTPQVAALDADGTISGGGLTWNKRISAGQSSLGGVAVGLVAWDAVNVSAVTNLAISFTPTTNGSYGNTYVTEIVGADTTAPYDGSNKAGATSASNPSMSSGAASNTTTDGIALVFAGIDSGSNPSIGTSPATSGYTSLGLVADSSMHQAMEGSYKILSAAASQSGTWATTNSVGGSGCWAGIILLYKGPSAAAVGPGKSFVSGPGISPNKQSIFVQRPLASIGPLSLISGTASITFGQSGAITGLASQGIPLQFMTGPGISPDYTRLFSAKRFGFPDVVASGAISGTASITFGQTGAITGAGALAATGAITFGQVGAVTGAGSITATGAITFGQTGAITGTGSIAAIGSLTFGQTGSILATGVLAGTSAIVFGQTGTLDQAGAMIGSGSITFGQTGLMTATGVLAGTDGITFGGSATADQPAGSGTGSNPGGGGGGNGARGSGWSGKFEFSKQSVPRETAQEKAIDNAVASEEKAFIGETVTPENISSIAKDLSVKLNDDDDAIAAVLDYEHELVSRYLSLLNL